MTTQPTFDPYRRRRQSAEDFFDAGDIAQAIKAAESIDRAQVYLAFCSLCDEASIPL